MTAHLFVYLGIGGLGGEVVSLATLGIDFVLDCNFAL